MKIGFVCNEYPPVTCGGIGTFTRELAEMLVAQGDEVHVFGVYADVTDAIHENVNGVEVHRYPAKPGIKGIWNNRRQLYNAVKCAAKEQQIEIIEIPDFEGYGAFWGRLAIPVVARLHGSVTYFNHELKRAPSRLMKYLELATLKRASGLISVTHYAALETLSVFHLKQSYDVIHNGIAWPEDSDCKQNYEYTGRVVFTGSLMSKKGVFALASAWRQVKTRFPDASLTLIGKDTTENGSSAIAKVLELAGDGADIHHTGHIAKAELNAIVKTADVAIFPSFSESFGLGPVEAMALAVPTIYTQLSCGPEIVNQHVDGVLIDPNDPDTISQALIELLGDEAQRERYGKAGRARAASFSVATQLAQNRAVYSRYIEATGL
ncbi:glycosyltransferase family 4 protein [Alteromonas facilis]|uniref:glycosyltransferase family 4 protein n=1 Tax=Alteromonas facilis TaxID=2048004 RepID=UPI000C28AC8D|nr:glycosyltransferase family 4 protein [Alteromonas facilis]